MTTHNRWSPWYGAYPTEHPYGSLAGPFAPWVDLDSPEFTQEKFNRLTSDQIAWWALGGIAYRSLSQPVGCELALFRQDRPDPIGPVDLQEET